MNNPKGTQLNTNKKRTKNKNVETIIPLTSLTQSLFLLRLTSPMKKLATSSKKKANKERIIEEINIRGTAINTSITFSKKVYSVSGSLNGASKYPKIINIIKTSKIKTKKTEKFNKIQDFDQEREYFSAIFSLKGENILYKTKPIIEKTTNNLSKSIKVPIIIDKSIQ